MTDEEWDQVEDEDARRLALEYVEWMLRRARVLAQWYGVQEVTDGNLG